MFYYMIVDFDIGKQKKIYVTRNTGNESEMEQVLCSLPETRKAVSSATLWRRQIYAVAALRFLKLRRERRVLLCLWVSDYFISISSIYEKTFKY